MIANLIRTLIIELFKGKLKMTIQDIQSLAEARLVAYGQNEFQ